MLLAIRKGVSRIVTLVDVEVKSVWKGKDHKAWTE